MKKNIQIFKKFVNQFNNALIYRKLLIIYTFAVLIPLFMITVFIFLQMNSFRTKEMIFNSNLISIQMKNNIENKINSAASIANNLALNSNIQMFFLESFDLNPETLEFYREKIYKTVLNAEVNNYPIIKNVSIYTNNHTIPETDNKILHDSRLLNDPLFSDITDDNNQISIKYYNSYQNETISYIRQIRTITNKYVGIIKIDFNTNDLFDLQSKDSSNIPILLLNEEKYLFATESVFDGYMKSNDSDKDYIVIGKQIFIKHNIPGTKLSAIFCFNTKNSGINGNMSDILIVAIIILSTLIVLIISLVLLKNVISKFTGLILFLKNTIKNQTFDTRTPVESKDEIGQIQEEINSLIGYIKKLIDETVIKETAQKDARYMLLQYQINPHFIYNTIDFFRFQLEIDGNEIVADALAKFGKMLRYNTSSTYKETTLYNELEHAINYIELQNFRNNNRIIFSCNMPNELKSAKITKFCLQPIIENSIKYGLLKSKETLEISIDICRKSNNVIITVTDNGPGINPRHLQRLNYFFRNSKYDYFDKQDENRIGLRNINERLKLLYGENYCIKIESEYDSYTKTILKFPFMDGER